MPLLTGSLLCNARLVDESIPYLEISVTWKKMSYFQLSLKTCTRGLICIKSDYILVSAYVSVLNQRHFINTQITVLVVRMYSAFV